ncbi:VTT domain-containing protein [Natronorubrum halalkaliphilum]|uniref:TVP38/TMEM64 family protein n=1 Tax=Natronorubrum halalkaliphilum TaxID=2691917 RepID=UPI001916C062
MSLSSLRTRAFIGAVLSCAILAAGVLGPSSAILGLVESAANDPLLFGLLVVGLYLVRPLLALPTTPLAVVVGYGYGVTLGVPIALLGVVTTVLPVFVVARWIAGRDDPSCSTSFDGLLGTTLERTGTAVTRYYDTAGPIRGVVASRLAPIPSDISTCAAAVSGVRVRHLLVGTAIGELPWTVAAVIVGSSAATVTAGGVGELGLTLTVACIVAAAALLAGPAYRAVQTRTQTRSRGRSTDS